MVWLLPIFHAYCILGAFLKQIILHIISFVLVTRTAVIVFSLKGAKGSAIEVDAIQAVVKKSNYFTNIILGEF